MESNNRKRSRKSKLVLRQVVELDEELQKILDISQDIQKPEENYLEGAQNGDFMLKIEKEEIDDDLPPEFNDEDEPLELPGDIPDEYPPFPTEMIKPMTIPKLMSLKPIEEANDIIVINNDHTYSMQESATNIQFSVNIEVEEFDDENIDTACLSIDENCDYGYRTNEISVRKDLFIDPNNEPKKLDLPQHVVNNIIIGKHSFHSRIEALPEHIVNSIILGDDYQKDDAIDSAPVAENIHKESCTIISDPVAFSEELLRTMNQFSSPADDFLKLFAINNYGTHLDDVETFHHVDLLIESALNTWMVWYRITKNLPMCYKCYVCEKAWWYLNDLRQHVIEKHQEIKIDMEVNDALCNIVAYSITLDKPPNLREIRIEGKCVTCFRYYDDHLQITCDGCSYKFATCGIFIKHIGHCKRYNLKHGNNSIQYCELCSIAYYNPRDFEDHFAIMHSVRSDVPVPRSTSTKCRKCDAYILYLKPHDCPGGKPAKKRTTCTNCLYRFFNPYILRNHIKFNGIIICTICKVKFTKQCSLLLHMVIHTSNYTSAFKCEICKDFTVLADGLSLKEHIKAVHNDQTKLRDWKSTYSQRILLPKKLYDKYRFVVNYAMDSEKRIISKTIDKVHISNENINQELNNEFNIIMEMDPKPKSPGNKRQKIRKTIKKPAKNNDKTNLLHAPKKDTSPKVAYEESSTFFSNSGGESGETAEEAGTGEEDGLDLVKVKTEIKEEPFDYDLFSGSIGMNFFNEETVNQSIVLEPEIIMGEMVLKRTYCCKICGFIGYHKQYKDHITSKVCKKHTIQVKTEQNKNIYRCTKCCEDFEKLKPYILHLTKHGFKLRACPECLEMFSTNSKLIHHLQMHIKDSYLRLFFLTDDQMKQNYCYQCRICKLRITENEFFEHWESHLEFNLKNEITVEVDLNERVNEIDKLNEVKSKFMIDTSKMRDVLEQLQKHRRMFDRSTDLSCALCTKSFNRKTDHKRHIIEHLLMEAYSKKPSNGGLKCQICTEITQRADMYKQHMRNHASLPIYRCELCNKSFSDSSNFAKHKKVHNLKVLVCDHCGKKFHKKVTLEAHIQLHMKNQHYACSLCPQKFLTLSKRTKHVRRVHDNIKPCFRCMICRQSFPTLRQKWDHQWAEHRERNKVADCPKCGQKFRKYNDVKRHVAEVHRMQTVLVYGEDGREEIQIEVD